MTLQRKLNKLYMWFEEDVYGKDYINRITGKFKSLQDYIKTKFPKRVVQLMVLHRIIKNQSSYIIKLQKILQQNGIEYPEPTDDPLIHEKNYDIEHLDDFAVRGPNETFEADFMDADSAFTK